MATPAPYVGLGFALGTLPDVAGPVLRVTMVPYINGRPCTSGPTVTLTPEDTLALARLLAPLVALADVGLS